MKIQCVTFEIDVSDHLPVSDRCWASLDGLTRQWHRDFVYEVTIRRVLRGSGGRKYRCINLFEIELEEI